MSGNDCPSQLRTTRWSAVLLCCLLLLPSAGLAMGQEDARRVSVGVRLFPALLAADENLARNASAENRLHLLIVYRDDPRSAERTAAQLNSHNGLQGFRLSASATHHDALPKGHTPPVAGLFINELLGEELDTVLEFGAERRVLLFSPFPGDVERGVPGGLLITDRILPHVNLRTLRAWQIDLKPFFLKVAVPHE